MNLVLLGPPGAGKGTQASLIKKKYEIPHISTGDVFRDHIKGKTKLGKRLLSYIDDGELVPDSIVIAVAIDRLEQDDCKDGFLLDGFPRTVEQAVALDSFLDIKNKKLDCVLNIYGDSDLLIDRLTSRRVCENCKAVYNLKGLPPKVEGICDVCGGKLVQRSDDNRGTVINRISVYNNLTRPLLRYYEREGNIEHLNGGLGRDKLFKEIKDVLGELQNDNNQIKA